jgi:hypothetical protein
LASKQYGFRSGASTGKATFQLTEEILKSLNNRMMAGEIFCDLHKALDCVNHSIPIKKN